MRRLVSAARRFSSAVLPITAIMTLMAGSTGFGLRADSCAENRSPQTVILERFQARDATVADVLEALVLLSEKASKRAYRPNFVIVGDAIGRMRISLDLTMAPLSEALDRIGELPGVDVSYRSNQTVVFSTKGS